MSTEPVSELHRHSRSAELRFAVGRRYKGIVMPLPSMYTSRSHRAAPPPTQIPERGSGVYYGTPLWKAVRDLRDLRPSFSGEFRRLLEPHGKCHLLPRLFLAPTEELRRLTVLSVERGADAYSYRTVRFLQLLHVVGLMLVAGWRPTRRCVYHKHLTMLLGFCSGWSCVMYCAACTVPQYST